MPFFIAFVAALLIVGSEKADAPRPAPLPCYPDTVTVIPEQIIGPDFQVTFDGMPVVTYRVILCVPEGIDIDKGRE